MPNNWLYTASADSVKSVTMNALDWKIMWGGRDTLGRVTETEAFAIVSWVRRCVELRCNALASIPVKYYTDKDPIAGSDGKPQKPEEADWEYADLMPRLLWMTEAALQLYGACYWLRLKNQFGFEKGYRWLLPTSVTPKYDRRKGLTHFERRLAGGEDPERLRPAVDLVYFWTPNLTAEIGPGKGWVSAVLTESAIAKHMNEFSAGFFERGAMPGTILSVEGNPPRAELDALEQWWKRFLSGVRRAWETVAIKATVKPVPIGNPPKDLAMPELLNAVRQQIAVAAGVPQTMLEDAANYATAVEHHQAFYEETIVPEAVALEATLNEQVFRPQGIRVVLDWQSLDIFQKDESERAQALTQLTAAGVPLDLAMEMLGMDLPGEMSYDQFRERLEKDKERGEALALEIAGARKPEAGQNDTGQREEARKWQRKAIKALKEGKPANVDFETDVFDDDAQTAIHERLALATTEGEVKAAFVPPFRRTDGGEGIPYP